MYVWITHNKLYINMHFRNWHRVNFLFFADSELQTKHWNNHFDCMLIMLLSFINLCLFFFFFVFTPTLDKPLAIPIHRVVSWPISDVSRDCPQNLSLALTVSCPDSRNQNHQNRQQESLDVRSHSLLHPQRAREKKMEKLLEGRELDLLTVWRPTKNNNIKMYTGIIHKQNNNGQKQWRHKNYSTD